MKLNYINVITNNSVWVINRLSNLLRKRNYSIEAFSAAFDEKGYGHILIWIEIEEDEELKQVISQISKLFDVKEVVDMSNSKKQIKYLFNVNSNCKKTLKKISREPDKVIETEKGLIYIFIIKAKNKYEFMQELNNLRFKYVYRVIWLT